MKTHIEKLSCHLPEGKLHIPSRALTTNINKLNTSFPIISKSYDAIILDRKCKKKPFLIKRKKLSSSHAYLIIRKKRKTYRVLYLPYCCIIKDRYVAPLQYYIGAVIAAIIFVIIIHFLSKNMFKK